MSTEPNFRTSGWPARFRVAFRGCIVGVRGQATFGVHFLAAALVVIVGFGLQVTRIEWCLLVMCITGVLSAEYFNSSLEHLAKAVDRQWNPHLANALDTASGAVLVASSGAVVVGILIFGERLWTLAQTWLK